MNLTRAIGGETDRSLARDGAVFRSFDRTLRMVQGRFTMGGVGHAPMDLDGVPLDAAEGEAWYNPVSPVPEGRGKATIVD
jgi:hypothetical protein